MDYNTKNYTEQGGDKTVIAGTLEIKEGATVTGLPSSFTPTENQAPSVAEDITSLVADFNALLLKLQTAGLMEADKKEKGWWRYDTDSKGKSKLDFRA